MEPRTICLLKNVTLLFLLEKVPLSIVIAVRKNEKKKLIITRIKKNEDINISYEFTDQNTVQTFHGFYDKHMEKKYTIL